MGGGLFRQRHYQKLLLVAFALFFMAPTIRPFGNVVVIDTSSRLVAQQMATPSLMPSPSSAPSPAVAPVILPTKPVTSNTVPGAQSDLVFGIAGGLASLPTAELTSKLAQIKALGVSWVRYDIEWSNIEYEGPGQYNWADYDKVVQAVSASGLISLAIIDYTPTWARRNDCKNTAMCAPADPATYAGFAAQVARRYSPFGVHHYEIWNEPNISTFFEPAADPAAYTALLKSASAAIRSMDTQAFIVSGGTAPASTGNGNYAPTDFVQGMYAAGAKNTFDALGHHPYTWPYTAAFPNFAGAWGQLSTLHNIMVARGEGQKKIWITEYGAPTGGPGALATSGLTTAEGAADHVTELLEARMVTDAVKAARILPWVGPFFWYSFQDAGTTNDTVENFFGLIRADGTHKPAYDIFKRAIQR